MMSLFRRIFSFVMLMVLSCAVGGPRLVAAANVVVTGSPTFTAAAAGRNYMDAGGVWSGTGSAANGDRFSITFTNLGDMPAHKFAPSIVIPAGFKRIGTVVSSPSMNLAVTEGGMPMTITLNPAGGTYDLAAGASITYTFGLRAEGDVVGGTYAIIYRGRWAVDPSGALNVETTMQQNVRVQNGAYVAELSPAKLTLRVNDTGVYTYKITNTGLGGLFNLRFDETASAPEAAWSFLNFGTVTVTPGALQSSTASTAGNIVTIAYLAPGASVSIPVTGRVTDCLNIQNSYKITHAADTAGVAASTPVELNLTKPLISYTLPTVQLRYGTAVSVTIPVQNSGNGDAAGVTLGSNLPSLGVTVSNVASGWTYNASTGVFTLTSGMIANAATRNLTFRLIASVACSGSAGGTAVFTAFYTDRCGNAYALPSEIGSILAPNNAPTLALDKTVSAASVAIGGTGSFRVRVTTSNRENLNATATPSLVISDVLPADIEVTNVTTTVGSTVYDAGTRTILWTIPVASLRNTQDMDVAYLVPYTPCYGGDTRTNVASTNSLRTIAGCDLSATSSATIYVSNQGGDGTIRSTFALDTATFPTTMRGGKFETGASSGDAIRDAGEGEFIPVVATYTIDAGYSGLFDGSSYHDDFSGVSGARLVPTTLQVRVNGGSWMTVPAGAVTSLDTASHLTVSLAFLAEAGYFNDPMVGGSATRTLSFRYRLTTSDADLGGAVSRLATQRATLTVAGATTGACTGGVFTQWVLYSVSRAEAGIAVSMPSSIELCQNFPVTLTVRPHATGASAQNPYNILATLFTGASRDYIYVTGQTPTYGGAFTAANMTVTENANGNPEFRFGGGELSAVGTITVLVRRNQAAFPAPLDTSVYPLTAQVDYDDYQSAVFGNGPSPAEATATPTIVRSGNLLLLATPQTVLVTDDEVTWTAYVTNGGNGWAYETSFAVTFPNGVAPASAAVLIAGVNTANGLSLPLENITVVGQVVTIRLGSLDSGRQLQIPLKGFLTKADCGFESIGDAMVASWGCGGHLIQTKVAVNPKFLQPTSAVQIVHDTTSSRADLCSPSTIEIIVRNVGLPTVSDLEITESLGSVTATGLSFVPGSVFVSLDGGAMVAAGNPTGTGTNYAGGNLVWTKHDIPALTSLSTSKTLKIRFSVTSNATTNGVSPVINASLAGKMPCGNAMSSPGVSYDLTVRKPSISVVKTGINRTAAGGSFGTGTYAKTVYGGVGDVVEWKVEISNSGDFPASQVRLRDVLGGSGGTVALRNSSNGVVQASYTNNTWVAIPDIAAGSVVTYYFVETLGATCVASGTNTSSVVWGCLPADMLTTPSNNSDSALVVMQGTFSSNGGTLTQVVNTSLPNGRVSERITFTNGGGTVKDLVATVQLPAGLDIDPSIAPALVGTNTSTYTGVTLSGTHAAGYVLTFTNAATGIIRNTRSVTVEVFYLPTAGFDTLANPAAPTTMAQVAGYQMPETTGNNLDPAAATRAEIVVTAAFKSTCEDADSVTNRTEFTSRSPDLDLTVSPTPLQFSSPLAPYTYVFEFKITNNGSVGSVADNIQFRLRSLGAGWTGVSARLVVPGSGGSVVTTTNGADHYLIDSAHLGKLAAGASAFVRVTAITANADALLTVDDLLLVGEVEGSLLQGNGTDTLNNYSLDRAAPLLTSDFNISGFVYRDLDHDGQRDPATEAGLGASTAALYAKAVQGGVAVLAVPVDMTTGFYQLSGLLQGDYTVIIDNNTTLADIVPTSVPNHIGTEMPTLTRDVSLGVASVNNVNFGLFRGAKITGSVFKDTGRDQDNGSGGGIPNDGNRQSIEAGISGVSVRATNGGATTFDTALTDADGRFVLWVPVTGGSAVTTHVIETNPSGFISTGASVGTSGGTYTRASDRIDFSVTAGTSYSNLDFGDVPLNLFLTDGQQTVVPGATVTYTHRFVASTSGKVRFAITSAESNPAQPDTWNEVLYLDANGDGEIAPGDTILSPTDEIDVIAGQVVNIVLKQFTPVAAPFNAQNKVVIAANFAALNNASLVYPALTRQDLTLTSASGTAGLDLLKTVSPATAKPGEQITYVITYTNNGSDPISQMVISDQVPAYTRFVSGAAGTLGEGLTGVVITNPAAPALTGAIVWTFTGALLPGQSGSVSFIVRVND